MIQETAPLRQEDQFRELFGVLRRRKWIVVATTLFFLLLGGIAITLSPATYQATARLIVRDYTVGGTRPVDPTDLMTQVAMPQDLQAQIGALGSRNLQNQAFSQAQVTPPTEQAEPPVTITQELGGPVLDLVVNWSSPEAADRIVQAIPDAYNAQVIESNRKKNDSALAAGRERLRVAKANVMAAEVALNNELQRQGTNGELVTQGGLEGTERSSRLSGYQQQLDAARIALATSQTQLQQSIATRDSLPKTIEDTNRQSTSGLVLSQKRTIADLEGQIRTLLVTELEGSPEIKALRARLAAEKAYLKSLPASTVTTPLIRNPERLGYDQRINEQKIAIQASQIQIAKLEAKVAQERAGLQDYERRIPRQHELQATLDSQKSIAANAAQTVANLEAAITRSQLQNQDQRPVETLAVSPAVKTQPVVARTLMASTLIGMVMGVVLALIRDRFDNRVYTLEQIYDVSGAMPIGAVSTSAKALGPNVGGAGRNRVLESYRSLRFNLESAADGISAQSVLVASASAGEGRAGLSLNLATEAATDQRKTILVDADMRTPELHDILKLSRGPGLSEVLSGTVGLDEALQPTSQPNMMFLSAGAEHGLPLELLAGPSFASLHDALKERADVIVLNSPSLMRYTDGRAIAKIVDSVLFVAKRGFTRRDAMRYCIGMLRRTKARLLGVVLSDDSGRPSDVPYYAAD